MSAPSSRSVKATKSIARIARHYTDPMVAASITPIIDRNYIISHAFQWVREAVVNSAQAGATRIDFTTEWQAAMWLGVHRRMIIDNGPGIAPEDMGTYLNSLGGSGKTVAARSANYGIGLKTSILPWNEYGAVLISRIYNETTDQSETYLMWLHKDRSTDKDGTYGARLFDVSEDQSGEWSSIVPIAEWEAWYAPEDYIDADTVKDDAVDWNKVMPEDQKSGFAIVLLGNSPTQDTILGDPNRYESKKYGLTAYLNARFWEFPIQIRTVQYENKSDRTTWPTAPVGAKVVSTDDGGVSGNARQNRSGKGLGYVLDGVFGTATSRHRKRGIEAAGSFEIAQSPTQPGVRLHWWLFAEEVAQRGDLPTLPLTAIKHESHPGITEVYDLAAMGENFTAVSARSRMNQFVSVGAVRDRMAIIVEPIETKQYAIYPEASRTRLMFESKQSGGQTMTWDSWTEAWRENVPAEIKAAVDAYYDAQAEKVEDTEADLADLLRFGMSDALTLTRVTQPYGGLADGALVGAHRNPRNVGGGRKVRAKKTTTVSEKASNRPSSLVDKQRQKAARLGLILATFVDEPAEDFAVRYDPTAKNIAINAAHPLYKNIFEGVVEENMVKGRIDADDAARRTIIEKEVRRQITRHITLGGSQAVGLSRENPEARREILSETALQAMLYGYRHIAFMVNAPLGQILGAKTDQQAGKNTSKAGAKTTTQGKQVTTASPTAARRTKQATAA